MQLSIPARLVIQAGKVDFEYGMLERLKIIINIQYQHSINTLIEEIYYNL